MEMLGGSIASYLLRTPCIPVFWFLLRNLEAKGFLGLQGRRGITSLVWWNPRPVIFGVDKCGPVDRKQCPRRARPKHCDHNAFLPCQSQKPFLGITWKEAENTTQRRGMFWFAQLWFPVQKGDGGSPLN